MRGRNRVAGGQELPARSSTSSPTGKATGRANSGCPAANIMIGAPSPTTGLPLQLSIARFSAARFGEKLLVQARAHVYGGHLIRNDQRALLAENDPATTNLRGKPNAGRTLTVSAGLRRAEDQRCRLEKPIEDLRVRPEMLPTTAPARGPTNFTSRNHRDASLRSADIALGTDLWTPELFQEAGRFAWPLCSLGMQGSFRSGRHRRLHRQHNKFLYARPPITGSRRQGVGLLPSSGPRQGLSLRLVLHLWDTPAESGERAGTPEDMLFEELASPPWREKLGRRRPPASFKCGPWVGLRS